MIATQVMAPSSPKDRDETLPEITGQTFRGHDHWQPVARYIFCTFVNCKNLHIGAGHNELVDCQINGSDGDLTVHGLIFIQDLTIEKSDVVPA